MSFTHQRSVLLFILFSNMMLMTNNLLLVNGTDVLAVEVLDLNVNATNVTMSYANFDYVTKMTFMLRFTVVSLDWNDFAGEGSNLTNGIDVVYAGQSILGGNLIDSNHAFGHAADRIQDLPDERATTGHIILAWWEFNSILSEALIINSTHYLTFVIQDDLTSLSSVEEFLVTLKGCTDCFEVTTDPVSVVNPVLTVDTYVPSFGSGSTALVSLNYLTADTYDYYYGAEKIIACQNLGYYQNYSLLIGANLNTAYYVWKNFTTDGQTTNAQVEFVYNNFALENTTGDVPNELTLNFYENNVLIDQLYLKLIFVKDQDYNVFLATNGPVLFGIGMFVILVILIIRRFYN